MSWWIQVADRDTCNKHWTAALPSRLTFEWMRGLLVKGWKKPLEMSDIGAPPEVDKCKGLAEQFEKLWSEEVKKENPSLILCCLRLFKSTYISSIVLRLFGDGMTFLSPFAVSGINIYIATTQVLLLYWKVSRQPSKQVYKFVDLVGCCAFLIDFSI